MLARAGSTGTMAAAVTDVWATIWSSLPKPQPTSDVDFGAATRHPTASAAGDRKEAYSSGVPWDPWRNTTSGSAVVPSQPGATNSSTYTPAPPSLTSSPPPLTP